MMIGMYVLALSDATTVGLWAVNLVISVVMAFILNRVVAATRKFERQEDSYDEKVERLDKELHTTATKLIDERFRAITHELNTHVQGFTTALDLMKEQLRDGDESIGSLRDRDQKIEMAVVQKMESLKDAMRDSTATKEDLRRHEDKVEKKFAHTDERIGEVREIVAGISATLKGRNPRG